MATIKYLGIPVAEDQDLVYRGYIESMKAENDPSEEEVWDAIDEGFEPYAKDEFYLAGDDKLATEDFVEFGDDLYPDAGDSKRIPLNTIEPEGTVDGVAGLDQYTGRVHPHRVKQNFDVQQDYIRGPWSPDAYNTGQVIAPFINEAPLYHCDVADPGYPYRLVVSGLVDARTYADSLWPIVRARVGVTVVDGSPDFSTGHIIAQGGGDSGLMSDPAAMSGDDFGVANSSNLGNDWHETYYPWPDPVSDVPGTFPGRYVAKNGEAVWGQFTDQGTNNGRLRRVAEHDQYTATDYQKITMQIGDEVWGQQTYPLGDPQYARIFARMNDSEDQYCYFQIPDHHDPCQFFYCNKGVDTQLGGDSPEDYGQSGAMQVYVMMAGIPPDDPEVPGGDPNAYRLYKDGILVMTVRDTAGEIAVGPDNRGWGFGGQAGSAGVIIGGLGQTVPPSIEYIKAQDSVNNYGTVTLVPYGLDHPALTGSSRVHVSLLGCGGAPAIASARNPKLHILAVPA